MSWCRWKFWRIADARNPWALYESERRDSDGVWKHIGGGFYWRTSTHA